MNGKQGIVERVMSLHPCADCPIRCKAVEHPHSFFARIHRWHSSWWPGYKIYQAKLRAHGAKATTRG
jgi:hypothetical protein